MVIIMGMSIPDKVSPQTNIPETQIASETTKSSRTSQVIKALASVPEKVEGTIRGSKIASALPVTAARAENAVSSAVSKVVGNIAKKDFFKHQFSLGGSTLTSVLTSLKIGTPKAQSEYEINSKIKDLKLAQKNFAMAYLDGSSPEKKMELREKLNTAFEDVAKLKGGNKEIQKRIHQSIGKAHIFLVNSRHLDPKDKDTPNQTNPDFRLEQSARRWYAAEHPDSVNPNKMLATANLQMNGLQSIMKDHLEKNVNKPLSKGESGEVDKAFRELAQLHVAFKRADSKSIASFTKLEASFTKFEKLYRDYNMLAQQNPIDKNALQNQMNIIQDLKAELQDIRRNIQSENPNISLALSSGKSFDTSQTIGDAQQTLLLAGSRTLNGYLETLSSMESALHYQIHPEELLAKNQNAIQGAIPPFVGAAPKGVTDKLVTIEKSQDNYLLFKAETGGKVYLQAHFRIDPEDGKIHGYKGLRDPNNPGEEKVWNTFDDFRRDLEKI